MDDALHTLAAEQGLDLEALRRGLADLRARAGGDAFYIFWTARRGGRNESSGRERMLLAFPSPDAALAFAQRNRLTQPPDAPRLRRLSLVQLLRAMLREPAIATLYLAAETNDLQECPPGRLPPGLHLSRPELLRLIGARP